jgi:DNA-binding response OmpR family regulator
MERLLIVEDSRIAQAKLSEILSTGYDLRICGSGPEAITAATDDPPDMVLLDIHLPGMNGYEVCRILKEYEPTSRIPVIFITGLDSEEERRRAFEAGAEDYITKPFFASELLARVRVHLVSRRAQAQTLELERLKLFREMAVSLSHEISAPVTSAYASVFLLERELGQVSEEARSNIRNILKKLDEIQAVIQSLSKNGASA